MNGITFDMDNNICAIRDMEKGTVFCHEGNWYMKTDGLSQDRLYATVVNLATGELGPFYCNAKVEAFSGILHINCRQD